jgi:hypothetical protein
MNEGFVAQPKAKGGSTLKPMTRRAVYVAGHTAACSKHPAEYLRETELRAKVEACENAIIQIATCKLAIASDDEELLAKALS